jgi:hypothetical protein
MSGQASPVVMELWDNFQDAHVMSERAQKAADEIRGGLVERHGDLKFGENGAKVWGHDPEYERLGAANYEADRLSNEEADCLDEFIAYPAKTTQDLAMKLAAVLYVWRQIKSLREEPSYHERIALALLEEAEKVLWPDVPVLEGDG